MSENLNNPALSYSKRIKTELLDIYSPQEEVVLAEIAAITAFYGEIDKKNKEAFLLNTDSFELSKKYFTLLDKTFKISQYEGIIRGEDYKKLFAILKLNEDRDFSFINETLINNPEKQKGFIRGIFLAGGSINNPNKSYHLEIVLYDEHLMKQVLKVFSDLGIPAKSTKRKSNYVLYLKDGTLISDTLGIIGAHKALMEFENVRILKGVRNDLNRRVNFEAANIKKTANAAYTQINDIEYIKEKVGLESLPSTLFTVAKLRMEFQDASLSELGQMLDPPVGKSGINHRIRRISQFAEKIRKERH